MDLPTESEIPWTKTAHLGAGVAAPNGELLKSAVEPFTAEAAGGQEEHFNQLAMESSQDVKMLVSVDVGGGFSNAAVSASAHTQLVNSLSVSSRSSTVICTGQISWGEAFPSELPRMTDEALDLYKRDRSGFHRAHGHYFIAGFTKESKLMIFARITGQKRESVLKISADVSAKVQSVQGKITADVAAAMENSAKKENCKIEIDLIKTGMSGIKTDTSDKTDTDGAVTIPGLALSQVPAHVEDFLKRAVGTRTRALLVHYTRVEPTVSTRIDLDPDMFTTANRFYEDLVLARVLKKTLPKNYAENMVKDLKVIEDDALKYLPRDLSGRIEKIQELRNRIEKWISSANKLEKYRLLWQRAFQTPGSAHDIHWGIINPSKDPELSDLDIKYNTDSLRKPYKGPGWQEGSLMIAVPDDRVICGIELTRNKSKNGLSTKVDGGVGEKFVRFKFKSEYDRGFNWTATVWSVPKDMASFEPDD